MELPDDVKKVLKGNDKDIFIELKYKNWRGEVGMRKIIPLSLFYGSTEWHKDEQWLLHVWDLDKNDYRDYALKDIEEWKFK